LAKPTCRRHWNPDTISYCSTAPDIVWRLRDMEGTTSPLVRQTATKNSEYLPQRRKGRKENSYPKLGALRALAGGIAELEMFSMAMILARGA